MTAVWLCMLLQYFDNEDALQLIGPGRRDEANYGYSSSNGDIGATLAITYEVIVRMRAAKNRVKDYFKRK